ncbi:ABC transporter ATP-binding protein [Anaeromyxobacter oryzae]|uniref:ABC transporter permease n=1 Tax=Anaeromyxobacter oryzae TaxID=2918170 RepID=A0ABM7X053_9BACT|nr:ABC transporter ATP-binding protein [Anaeromyxobacter oryzae]BDG05169.1 ABC transporter permease [Anaeromyxobacter oryzae]
MPRPRREEPASSAPTPIRKLFRAFGRDLAPFRASIAALVVASMLSPALETAAVWLFKLVVDRVLVPRALAPLGWLALLLTCVAIADGAVAFADRLLSTSVSERFLLALRARVLRHVLGLSLDGLERRRLGDVLSRLTGDSASIESFLVSGLTAALADVLRVIFFATALFVIDWRLAAVALVALPLFALAVRRFTGRIREIAREARRRAGAVSAVAEESLSNAALVQAYGREQDEVDRFRREGLAGVAAQLSAARLRGLLAPLVDLIELAGGLAVIAIGTGELSAGRVTLGGLLVFVTYVGKLYQPVRGLGTFVTSAHSAAAAAERIVELLEQRPSVEDRPSARPLLGARGEVVFEDVSFRYPGAARDALSGVSFRVRPGELLAVVGASGSGKSTIVNLLLRFYEPTRGRILVDGHDLRDLTLRSLRDATALVLQETLLLHASIRENVAYGQPGADDAAIARAVHAADLDGVVAALPEGLDSTVGQRGRRLSGGERQRLALARALVRGAPILLLDEPTAALDAAAADRVLAPLQRAMSGRTTILVSHDISTIRSATTIVVLDGGRVVERGTHAALAARGGPYARLLRARERDAATPRVIA